MPEGDTIARAAATLHAALAGQPVTHAESVLADVSTAFAARRVVGRTVERVTSHGKHLALTFSGDLVLRTHMRMHGAWHLYRPDERWRRAAHRLRIRLDTPPWVALAFDVYDAEVVPGQPGESFEWGLNYHECGVVKFFAAQDADAFTPYMCVMDYLLFPAMGVGLQRTGTIAHGCTHCDFRFKHGGASEPAWPPAFLKESEHG